MPMSFVNCSGESKFPRSVKRTKLFPLFFKLTLTLGIFLESYPGLTLLCLFFAFIFEAGSHEAQADLKLTMYLKMSLDY